MTWKDFKCLLNLHKYHMACWEVDICQNCYKRKALTRRTLNCNAQKVVNLLDDKMHEEYKILDTWKLGSYRLNRERNVIELNYWKK